MTNHTFWHVVGVITTRNSRWKEHLQLPISPGKFREVSSTHKKSDSYIMPRSFSSNYMWICTVNRWIKLAYRFHGHSPQIFMRKVDHSAPLVWDWHVFLELHSSLLPLDELCTVLSDNKVATFAVWLVLECNIWNKFRRITWPASS